MHIAKHVLKTLCTDVTNILLNSLAADMMMSVENPATISSEVRRSPWCRTTRRQRSQPDVPLVFRLRSG